MGGMNNSEILIYQNPDGKIRIDVRLEDETVWLTQDHMAPGNTGVRMRIKRESSSNKAAQG